MPNSYPLAPLQAVLIQVVVLIESHPNCLGGIFNNNNLILLEALSIYLKILQALSIIEVDPFQVIRPPQPLPANNPVLALHVPVEKPIPAHKLKFEQDIVLGLATNKTWIDIGECSKGKRKGNSKAKGKGKGKGKAK